MVRPLRLVRLLTLSLGLVLVQLAAAEPQVKLLTSEGDILIELNTTKAPATTENFLQYVRDGYYDGTLFHRVIPDFMIQGGGFEQNGNKKATRDPIFNESRNGLLNTRGTIAMARTPSPHSATAQFFINTADNPSLNAARGQYGYAVFGKVVEGMDVVDLISALPTGRAHLGGYPAQDVPTQAVVIKRALIVAPPTDTSSAPKTTDNTPDAR